MECTLATLVACFSWSNLYLDTGIAYQDRGEIHHFHERHSERIVANGVIETGWTDSYSTVDWINNPYGRFSIGYEISLSAITLRIEGAHTSSVTTKDRGMNSISLNARWYPFR
jgi:hypothetical protein